MTVPRDVHIRVGTLEGRPLGSYSLFSDERLLADEMGLSDAECREYLEAYAALEGLRVLPP